MAEKSERELRLYYFITKKSNNAFGAAEVKEGVITTLSFDLDGALDVATKMATIDTTLVFAGFENISKILDKVDMAKGNQVSINLPVEISKKVMAKDEFKNNILLAADTMIIDVKDRSALKRIISKIK